MNNYTVGYYAPMDTSCGLGDWGGEEIMAACSNCNSDFSNLIPGEWLYKENHIGYYIGDGQVIECTVGWDVWAITVSQVDKYGNRSRNGVQRGNWLLHGMVPWLDYSSVLDEETWIEKACFDAMVYRDRYPDLAEKTDEQLKEHWLNYGIKEGRSASTILDLKYYVENNSDLKSAFGTDYEKAYDHFITKGYKEHRKMSPLFDGTYYTDKYTDTSAEFLKHYVETGMKEGRRASQTYDPEYYLFVRPDVGQAWPGNYEMAARHYAGHGIREGIVAYDDQDPVISDAAISNITAQGYTVTCNVTDNWGLTHVSFPTWTVLNDQDDLAADFMNTQQGTKNGNSYTFQVKASDHNNEGGYYATHIYAVDKAGNTVSLQLDPVAVKDPSLDRITLITDSQYTRSEDRLYSVRAGTAVSVFLTEFENEVLQVVDCNGNVITGAARVGTGAKVNLLENGKIIDTVTVIVPGDVDGNGVINTADQNAVKSSMRRAVILNDYQREAADVDGYGTVNINDYQRIKAHALGKQDLYALY